jgi:hypothetical protein
MTSEAPVRVAECPPLALGGTPSICGNAQSHCLSTVINFKELVFTYLLHPLLVILLPIGTVAFGCRDFAVASDPSPVDWTSPRTGACPFPLHLRFDSLLRPLFI